MAISTALQVVYSSAPVDDLILSTIEINIQGLTPLRFVDGFEDHYLGGFPDAPILGTYRLFEATSISLALPSANTQGTQSLRFGFANASSKAMEYVEAALAQDKPAYLIYREYLLKDKSQVARVPYTMAISGGSFDGADVVFEASYMDLLNLAYPRTRYTSESAPAVEYL